MWVPLATMALRTYGPRAPFDGLADATETFVLELHEELTRSLGQARARAGGADGPDPVPPDAGGGEELRLADIVEWLTVPRAAGWFLSGPDLARLAGQLALPAPPGPGRRDALATLLHSAGADGRVDALLTRLDREAGAAQSAYGALAERWPAWEPIGLAWAERTARTRGFLRSLRAVLDSPG
jgi:hypothetical protein